VSVSKGGGRSGRLSGSPNASTDSSVRAALGADLTPDRQAEARRLDDALQRTADADRPLRALFKSEKGRWEAFWANAA
jgi:hypothetical protein